MAYSRIILRDTRCSRSFWTLMVTSLLFFTIFLSTTKYLNNDSNIYVVIINPKELRDLPLLDEKFLSIAIDAVVVANRFKNFNMTDPKLIKMTKALTPAYFRVGGNLADRLQFTDDDPIIKYDFDDYFNDFPNFTMNKQEWLNLNEFIKTTQLKFIFNLNSLMRFQNGSWDYRNAEQLIKISQQHNLFLNWELGNEPNSYLHKFNYSVSPQQLAKDFKVLKDILKKYPNYRKSLILGPSVTRPRVDNRESEIFLQDFLESGGSQSIDVVSWHQYYFAGRTAVSSNFLDPFIFDILKWQIEMVRCIVDKAKATSKPIWLGETASAYGGGAPGYSDRFIGTFIWLDKLGVSAAYGIDIVIRQSLFEGNYSLIDNNNYQPHPDWWISVLFKRLVGRHVIPCSQTGFLTTRIYCHCDNNTFTLYGMNLDENEANIKIEGFKAKTGEAYILNTNDSLTSRNIFLNGKLLELDENNDLPTIQPQILKLYPYIKIPKYSLFFLNIDDDIYCT